MTAPLGRLLSAQQWWHRRAFEAATERPAQTQARLLRTLLRANAHTAFGRDHGFENLRTPRQYTQRVPVRDYEALRPYVARAAHGEAGVLTAEAPLMFATTSGTTGEPKLIPVTATSARQSAALMRLWTVHALAAHPRMLDRRILTLVGPALEGYTPGGVPHGAMTGMTYQRLPWLVRRRQALPYAVALIGDHATRYFVAARLALAGAISSIGTPNASTLLRLADTAARRGDDVIRAIHDGVLGVYELWPLPDGGMGAAALGVALTSGLRPDRERARWLAAVAARSGRLVLGEWRACTPALPPSQQASRESSGQHLDAHVGAHVPRRDLGLVASEGRLTIPVEDGSAAGVLAVHTTFFEFIAEEDIDDAQPRSLLCHELVDGRRYYVILTGANGLYRYDLNDVVQVRGFHGRTPRVAFVRKGRDMLSITGEKLHLNHVLHAVRTAERASGLATWQARLIPDVEAARYDLLVELPRPAEARPLAAFVQAFDRALADANIEYASRRASDRLAMPRMFVMRRGWSERVCRQEIAQGRRENQHKWSTLRPEWDELSRTEVERGVDPGGLDRMAS